MPRRKQGQSKETVSAADHEKKRETVGETVQNEVPEKPPALKEWKSKNKRQELTFNSAIDHNGKAQSFNTTSDSNRSIKHFLDQTKDGDWYEKDNKRDTSKNNSKFRSLDKYNNLSKKRSVEIQNECCLTIANVKNLNSVDKPLTSISTHIKENDLQKAFPCSAVEELNAKSHDYLAGSSNNELPCFKISNKNMLSENELRFADNSLTSITACTSNQTTCSSQPDLKDELSIPKSSVYSTCNQKSPFENSAQNLELISGNNTKENKCMTNDRVGKCTEVNMSSQMSGLSPAIITTTHQGNHAEVLQLNYRVSTSVTETKSSSLNGRYVPMVSSSETCNVLDNRPNCQLPSSVYGTSASNIETVLTGLHLFDSEKSKSANSYSLMPLKGSFLQEILEDQNVSEQNYVKLKDISDHDKEEKTENKTIVSPDVQPLKPCAEGFKIFNPKHEIDKKESDIISEMQSSKLKLHIPELSSAEDSDSSQQQSTEISKSLKFPKITSPQILEQHISKIISENAAIVETLDPLWSRRYLRQSSLTSSQNVDAEIKKSSISTRIRRYSDDKLPLGSSVDQICHSKLQSALLGSFESEQNNSQSQPSNLSASLHPSSSSGTNSLTQLNNSSVPAVGIFSRISNCSVSEEELQGSAVKSLLSLKQGKYSKHKNSFFFNKEMCNKHPQNPEGSIIKDLLLKTRSKSNHDFSPGCEGHKLKHTAASSTDFYSISDNKLDEMHSPVYLCTNCGSRCRTKENLDAHIAHCKGAKELTFAIRDDIIDKNINSLSNNYTQPQSISKEKIKDTFPTILNPSLTGCNDVQEEFKVETAASVNIDDAIGHILKKQLLSPLVSSQSPPLKKRKISEPVISMNKLEDLQVYQANDVISISKSVSLPRQLDGISISPHRCRSQSVHLFGGEVQILDGVETKKLKITTSLQGAFPLAANSLSNDFSFRKMSVVEENAIDLHNSSLPTVVVTIAQPVHNSGGTVMHVHKLATSSSLSPVVTVSNHLISAGIEKFSELGNPPINSFSVNATKCDSPTFPIFPMDNLKKVENNRNNQGTNKIISESLSSFTESSLSGSLYTTRNLNSASNTYIPDFALSVAPLSSTPVITRDFKTSQQEKLSFPNSSIFLPEKESPLHNITSATEQETCLFGNKIPIEAVSTCSYSKQNVLPQSSSEVQSTHSHIIPIVTLTPSSPTFLLSADKEPERLEISKSDNSKKFLAPSRPTSLPLKKKPFTMVGSTLISPETPRPKKSCVQLYLNGHAYTYLGLKCSTRSTYCCIYRPQPMYVPQDNNSKLSMYSNWQVVPAKEELSGLTPGQMISYYDSRQRLHSSDPLFTMPKIAEPLSFTHSSYWVFRTQDQEKIEAKEEINEHQCRAECPNVVEKKDASNCSLEHTQNASMDSNVMIEPSVPADSVDDDISRNNKEDGRPSSAAESSQDLDGSAALSGVEENGTYDDDDDYQEDGAESVTDSSLPQPPKRVKIFEGGFKSNEDYTYVRGRGRGKYVCEECGIRCKKPSMLKKHIRTHTDLRPYKCRHCSFAFKTKGNLTKHMKSKAHHKKCTELGIIPVPTTTDDSQIDEDALAKQEQLERKNPQFSDGEEADDDDDDELDDDLEDSDGLDDDCESDSGIMSSNQKSRSLTNGHAQKCDSLENTCDEQFEDSSGEKADHPSQRIVEQEAAHSLLHLSALNEPSQWSTSTGEMTDVTTSSHSETENTSTSSIVLGSSVGPVSPHKIATVVTNAISPVSVKMSADQSSVLWLSPEPLGHRPRSYSADIPYTSNREHDRFQHSSDLAFESSEVQTREQSEFGSREHYGRRYSISVTSEARKPTRILQPPNWSNSSFSNLSKWPEVEASDQPMDLRIIRGNTTDKPKQEYHIAISNSPALTVTPQEDNTLETHIQLSPETCLGEHYQQKLLPVLSPQALAGYDSGGDNSSSDAGLASVTDEHQSYNTSIFLPRTSILYMPHANTGDTQLTRKEMEVTDDQPSPEALDYAACSPVTPPPTDENSYYYTQENLVGGQSTISPEEMPPSSRGHHAEFIVPSTSSGLEEGRCICRICNKIFSKSSQLRLHVNIHYFERPFRCDNCAVSFRTKGHLQKHKRSVSHYNKVNMNMTFGTPTVDNPRPFKCADCKIAFRIHGHLAKHLRSKMHIMKLECLGKLPFGMYAEMERSGVSLNEIDTTDCNNSLESLQVMAQRLYQRDPRRMRWHNPDHTAIDPESAKSTTPLPPVADAVVISELPVNSYTQACAIGIPAPSMINLNQNVNSGGEVKQEPSELESFHTTSSFSDGENPVSPTHQYSVNPSVGEVGQEAPRRIEAEGDSDISLHRSCTCHLCGRLFKSAKFLQVHLYCDHVGWNPPSTGEVPQESSAGSPSHSAVTQNLICDLCGKHFSNQNILQQHLLSHAQPRPFVCEVCDAGFTSSALLVAHLATHEHIGASGCSEATLVQLR